MPDFQKRPLRVFLCHAKEDKPAVRELHSRLSAEGWMDVWLDEEKLFPGQDWSVEIEKAVDSADAIIVCLSNNSVTKEGYVQREIRIVLDLADYKPEGTLFVFPVRLEDCEPPRRLRQWQYADFFPENQREHGYERLLISLRMRAERLGVLTAKSAREQVSVASGEKKSPVRAERIPTKPEFDRTAGTAGAKELSSRNQDIGHAGTPKADKIPPALKSPRLRHQPVELRTPQVETQQKRAITRSPDLQSNWAGVIFGLGCAQFGIIALVAAYKEYQSMGTGEIIWVILAGLVFSIGGIALTIGYIKDARAEKAALAHAKKNLESPGERGPNLASRMTVFDWLKSLTLWLLLVGIGLGVLTLVIISWNEIDWLGKAFGISAGSVALAFGIGLVWNDIRFKLGR